MAQSDIQLPTHDTEFMLSGLLFLLSRPWELRDSQAAELGLLLCIGSPRLKRALHLEALKASLGASVFE